MISIDEKLPTKDEFAEIIQEKCTKCDGDYIFGKPAIFVKLASGKYMWWHGMVLGKYLCKPSFTYKRKKGKCSWCCKIFYKTQHKKRCCSNNCRFKKDFADYRKYDQTYKLNKIKKIELYG